MQKYVEFIWTESGSFSEANERLWNVLLSLLNLLFRANFHLFDDEQKPGFHLSTGGALEELILIPLPIFKVHFSYELISYFHPFGQEGPSELIPFRLCGAFRLNFSLHGILALFR